MPPWSAASTRAFRPLLALWVVTLLGVSGRWIEGQQLFECVDTFRRKGFSGQVCLGDRALHTLAVGRIQNGLGVVSQYTSVHKPFQLLALLDDRATPTPGPVFGLVHPLQNVSHQHNQ